MKYLLLALVLITSTAQARWRAEYAEAPQATQDWYRAQQLTPAARLRFQFTSCCDNSDVVKTKFKVNKINNQDEWWWLNNNVWERVPDDIIHWGEATPDGQAILFVSSGRPTCFFPPQSGN